MHLFNGPGRIAASTNIANRNLRFIIHTSTSCEILLSSHMCYYRLLSTGNPSKIWKHLLLFQSPRLEELFNLCATVASLQGGGKPIEMIINTRSKCITLILP